MGRDLFSGVGRGFASRHKGAGGKPQARVDLKAGYIPVKLGADDFLGEWQITREITDFRILEAGTLEGMATFTPTEAGLRYFERGTLSFAGGAPLVAERSYLWSFTETEVFVAYADGAPFHSFARAGGPEATPHLCGEDLYHGTYSFVGFPDWQVTWTVKGPRKDYRSITRYARA